MSATHISVQWPGAAARGCEKKLYGEIPLTGSLDFLPTKNGHWE
jgi:hypothetical protein